MEIERIEAIGLRRELSEPFANAQKWITSREYCLVRVESAGHVGWGECWGPITGNREIIEGVIAPWLRGRDPSHPEAVHDDLVTLLRGKYHSYVPWSAVSGIDVALWDLLGKREGKPISGLLGGRRRESIRAYATGGFWPDVESFEAVRESVVAEARAHVDRGFGALKTKIGLHHHFGWDWRRDVELVRAIRDAVGPDVRVMADANHAYDVATARQVGSALAGLDVAFFEEPLAPERVGSYGRLQRDVEVPLAAGECWSPPQFDRALESGAVGYVQPDVTSTGGLTPARRVVTTAAARNVQAIPHVFGSTVALAASLQLLATARGNPMLEFDRTPNPIRDDLATTAIENDGPEVPIPEGPGLGVGIDPEVLADFRVE
jgi:D-galactarolactone cycloisomerase